MTLAGPNKAVIPLLDFSKENALVLDFDTGCKSLHKHRDEYHFAHPSNIACDPRMNIDTSRQSATPINHIFIRES